MSTKVRIFITSVAILLSTAFIAPQSQATLATINVAGVTVEVEDSIACPTSGNILELEIPVTNGTGEELQSVDVIFQDIYGQQVAIGTLSLFKPGLKKLLKIILSQSASRLKCTEIAKVKVFVNFVSSSSKSDTSLTQNINVTQIGIAIAAPTPTPVAMQTTQSISKIDESSAQIESLKAQVAALKSQIKKICSNKLKPKGC